MILIHAGNEQVTFYKEFMLSQTGKVTAGANRPIRVIMEMIRSNQLFLARAMAMVPVRTISRIPIGLRISITAFILLAGPVISTA